jgi:hypothetical protein
MVARRPAGGAVDEGAANRGKRAVITPDGEVQGSGAGAGGGGAPEDYDDDPQAGGGKLDRSSEEPPPGEGGDAPVGGMR